MIYIKENGVTVEDGIAPCVRLSTDAQSLTATDATAETLLRGLLIWKDSSTKDAVLGAAIDEVLRLTRDR